MLRLRIATLVVAAAAVLACGCCRFAGCPLLGRFRCCPPTTECCETAAVPDCGGAVVEESGPSLGAPGCQAPPPGPPLAPQNTMPQLAPAPRLVPQPQAPTVPYTP